VRSRLTGLWAHPDFLKLWGAQTISQRTMPEAAEVELPAVRPPLPADA
jgi:hypothetical protein